MAQNCFHASIEGAQHGAKTLAEFLTYAKRSGASGAQPSNFMLQDAKGRLKKAREIKDTFAKAKLSLDGISAHSPFWVHTTAWTSSPTVRPFVPAELAGKSPEAIEQWSEDYLTEPAVRFHPDPAALKQLEADLLVLTAVPGSIDETVARELRAGLVCELTGAAVTGPAKRILKERHIEIIPENLDSIDQLAAFIERKTGGQAP